MILVTLSWCCVAVVVALVSRCYSEDLSNLDNLNEDIWNFEEASSEQWAEQALQTICEQYELISKNGKISCDDITLSIKLLNQDDSFREHDIVKRDADEAELEGSGEPDHTTITPPMFFNQSVDNLLEKKYTQENSSNFSSTSAKPKIEQASPTIQMAENGTLPQTENITEVNKSENQPEEIGNKTDVASKVLETDGVIEQPNQEEKSSENQEMTSTTVSADQDNKDREEKETKFEKETQLETKESADPKEKETIDEQQDANTEILMKQPGGSVLIKSAEISEGEKILNSVEVDENNVAESTKNVTKASKDTTILIVLFAVVVVVGGAAFTYNKIKERRNKRSASANNVNGKTDIEQGRELKPLMKNDQKSVTNDGIKGEETNEKS